MMHQITLRALGLTGLTLAIHASSAGPFTYPVVDTGQERCYDASSEIEYPQAGGRYFGQDAQYTGKTPEYRDNGDGTVSDLVTGLMWQKTPGPKVSWTKAMAGARKCRTGGHADWRLPSIKELYSLILFTGIDPDPMGSATNNLRPFIDTDVFDFSYGDPARNERIIDSQYASSTKYVSTTMRADETVFGVNFADGRIKGYPVKSPRGRGDKLYCVLYVRGNPEYGRNKLEDNGNGTITDGATGLTWMKVDSGHLKAGPGKDGMMNWEQALAWSEELDFAGKSDWRLPTVKELQTLVDYSRSPDTSNSAAIDPVFQVTAIRNAGGKTDYPQYWSGTTHVGHRSAASASYVAFGRALGWMQDRRSGQRRLLDVHGAGAQRSDPKDGDPSRFPYGRGPQGDVIRILNCVRCVRGGEVVPRTEGPEIESRPTRSRQGRRPDAGAGRPSSRQPPHGQSGAPGRAGFAEQFVRRMDRNGDGKVARSEFHGPPNRFSRLDVNRDGTITVDEAPQTPPRGAGGPLGGGRR